MKITQLELILTHLCRKKVPSQAELFSIFYFKSVRYVFQKSKIRCIFIILLNLKFAKLFLQQIEKNEGEKRRKIERKNFKTNKKKNKEKNGKMQLFDLLHAY